MKEKLPWLLFGAVAACAIAALVGLLFGDRDATFLWRVPDFTVNERGGRTLARRDLLGEVWVAQFIFTRCAGTCPVMVSRMYALSKKLPQAKYVSFTVDPEHDTPEVLARYARNNSLPPDWLFATGTQAQMQSLAKDGFKISMGPGSKPEEPIIHSDRFVLVDRYGRVRSTHIV